MIDINVIASGSSGNCTCLTTSSGEKILCDIGIPLKKIFAAIKFENPDYVIVTHEHSDHAHLPAIKSLLERGTQIYMTLGTRDALKLKNHYNLHTFKADLAMTPVQIGSCQLLALNSIHDAQEPIVFEIFDADDRILYATDTHLMPIFANKKAFTKIIIETNFDSATLEKSSIENFRKDRIFATHLSIDKALGYFNGLKELGELDALKEVHLIHISKLHGDGSDFKKSIQKIIGDIPIYPH